VTQQARQTLTASTRRCVRHFVRPGVQGALCGASQSPKAANQAAIPTLVCVIFGNKQPYVEFLSLNSTHACIWNTVHVPVGGML
jgi:hypothetical protein